MSDLRLAGPFTNHLVLQQQRESPIWGWDLPGQRVAISIEGGRREREEVETTAASDGRWALRLPALPAGGPYRIRVRGSSERTLSDVLVGEVWLASGQSNMEWKVRQLVNSQEEIHAANFDAIRVLKVPNRAAQTAEHTFDAQWCVCSPDTVDDFTAIGYFFAREIHRALGVPVGIVDASWGGTYVEAWTSLESLRPVMPELPDELATLALESTQIERIREEYFQRVRSWERQSLPVDPGNLGLLDGWAAEHFDDGSWKEMDIPRFWQNEGLHFNGVVWFRKTIDVPKSWAGRDLLLKLGAIDDFDQTYFNGTLVGEHPDGTPNAYSINREYRVPGSLVHAGRNQVAVRVFDHAGSGGFAGPRSELTLCKYDGSTRIIPLAGPWKYAVELEIPLVSMQVFRTFPPPPRALAEQHAPAALFHGMIAPLLPYGLRGILWYQGENNAEAYHCYRDRLLALIRDWRTRFGQGTLPFLLVQLAGFRASETWPHLREAQMQVRQEPEVAIATAIDIGDPDDIHPPQKRAVAQRLSRLALRRVYGQSAVVSDGPEIERVTIERERVRVEFSHASGLKTADGGANVKGFELAGIDGRYVPANARIEEERVIVSAEGLAWPCSIRYAWRDFPEVNLVNGADLPALPFRSDSAAAK